MAENEDMSPLETDPEKLAHKYKEVREEILNWSVSSLITANVLLMYLILTRVFKICHLSFTVKLQIKHAVTQAEIQQLKRKVGYLILNGGSS